VGFVFQQYNLFPHLNVLQNITLAPEKVKKVKPDDAKTLAINLLKQFGLADKAQAPVQELSGGQKQRIAIARALAMQPKLLLLDEPTSALDPVMSQEVLDAIEILARQKVTLIIVTHEVGFAFAVADKIVFMDQGKIIYQGSPQSFTAEVINSHPSLQRYFSQFQQKQQLLINLSPLQSR
jgi:polar amino acid transport system ATP-binding protein